MSVSHQEIFHEISLAKISSGKTVEMDDIESKCAFLRAQIAATESQLAALRQELESAEKAASTNRTAHNRSEQHGFQRKWPLFADEYRRYGRQMIVPQLGLEGL